MNDQVGDSEQVAALDLDGHRVDRLLPQRSSGLPRLMRYEVWATGSTIPVSVECESKGRDVLGRQGGGVPLVVVLGEELNGLEVHGVRAARTARSQPPAIDM